MAIASQPTIQLAEALRELANAAYGDPNASWSDPQSLVRDALKTVKVSQITPQMVEKAILWHNSQSQVLAISPTTAQSDMERVMDAWLVGILTAALIETDPQPTEPLTLHDLALEQYNTPADTATFHFLVKGEAVATRVISIHNEEDRRANNAACRVLTNEWAVEDKKERNRQWLESLRIIFGEEIKSYLDRLVL